jgi:lysozyme
MMDIEAQLERDEGCVLHAYPDSKGYWTLGIGILVDKRRGGGITREEAIYLLRNRLRKIEFDLIQNLPWLSQIDPIRYYALVNMAYQMGVGGLLQFRKMLAAVKKRDWAEAAIQIMDSKYASEDSPERAERMAKQMITGMWQ